MSTRGPFGGLSPNERRVLEQLAAGRSLKETALSLGITPASVKTYRRRVRIKLGGVGRGQEWLQTTARRQRDRFGAFAYAGNQESWPIVPETGDVVAVLEPALGLPPVVIERGQAVVRLTQVTDPPVLSQRLLIPVTDLATFMGLLELAGPEGQG